MVYSKKYSTQIPLKNPFYRPWMKENGAASVILNDITIKAITSGTLAAALETAVLFPLEYVKTQLQLNEKSDASKKYSGIKDCLKKTVSRHGFFGLYRGMSILLIGAVPKSVVRFGSYETFRGAVVDENGSVSPAAGMYLGFSAGATEAALVVVPMETVKVKLINDQRSANPRFKGVLQGINLIIKEQGFRGIYQGLTPTFAKHGSNQAIRFYFMETLREQFSKGDSTIQVPKLYVALTGVLSGSMSVLLNTPMDVVKTRMQGFESLKYSGTIDCVVKTWTNEGPSAFYKGGVARMAHVCLGVSTNFVLYYYLMEVLNKYWH